MEVNLNGIKVKYNSYGFIFNPYTLYMYSTQYVEKSTIRVTVDPGGLNIVIDRVMMPYVLNAYWHVSFDISGALRLLFNPDEFWQVMVNDHILSKDATVRIEQYFPSNPTPVLRGEIKVTSIWGALQVGEPYADLDIYKHHNTYIMWPGLPFTVPLLKLDSYDPLYWSRRDDDGPYEELGPLTFGKYNLKIDRRGANDSIVLRFDPKPMEEWPGVYSKEFDHTFKGFDRLRTFWINIKIAPCERPDSVYLRWIGPLGGWYYFLFDRVSTARVTTDKTPFIEPYFESINDFSYMDHPGTGSPVGKTGQENLNVMASLIEPEIYEYVQTLETSPIVYMQVQGGAWTRVNIAPGTFTRTRDQLQDISFTINKPQLFLQSL